MPTLTRELRKTLERVVKDARRVAEAGARKAIEELGVHRDAWPNQPEDKLALRRRLLAHGKQLGDRPGEKKGERSIDKLVGECGYEHWHRLLFARFLAECGLLIEPTSGVAISLGECKELAAEDGVDWLTLASRFAQRMLPQIFRTDDPVLELSLPPETRQELERLVTSLPADVFLASDSLGWVYQFWQAERKDAVNAAGGKIGADELPAVTQLFTEDYMVDFLLDNTLGAWHAGRVLAANPVLAETAADEEALRSALALPGAPWKYLRFLKDPEGRWTPAAGVFEGWPKAAKELTCLDPCMGSGHFIVGMFERLVALRVAEEGASEAAAVAGVIRDNLFGLEIDPRCTQIAAFNLALAAWRRVGHQSLPPMNLACSGLAPHASEAEWLALARDDQKLQLGMKRLYRLFQDAPTLGSLINPGAADGDLLEAGFRELKPLLDVALKGESEDVAAHEMAVAARGLANAAELLGGHFTLVATNVPYLGRGKQSQTLQEHCARAHSSARADLATAFVERCLGFCAVAGSTALVTPQNWLFLGAYRQLRDLLLRTRTWNFSIQLGANAFQDMNWWAATTALVTLTAQRSTARHAVFGIDVSVLKDQPSKATLLRGDCAAGVSRPIVVKRQTELIENPDARIAFGDLDMTRLIGRWAKACVGFQNGDTLAYLRSWWEIPRHPDRNWRFIQMAPETTHPATGLECCLSASFESAEVPKGSWHNQSSESFDRVGVLVRNMGTLAATRFYGGYFDQSATAICCAPDAVAALWAFVESPLFHEAVRSVEPKVNVTPATFGKVPVDLEHWRQVAAHRHPEGLPKATSTDPTQWLFNGHPKGSDRALQVAVARLVGYSWPRQTGSSFPDCPALDADGLEKLADRDGIVCLSAAKGEGPAHERVRELLAGAWGRDWTAKTLEELLAQVGYAGKSLDDWLRNGFFEQHCELFHQRPFVWHVWDGRRDGFAALVNYHRLAAPNGEGRRTLQKLTFSYLGEWIDRQRADEKAGVEGADARLVAATHLKSQLEAILEGEPPFDIFVRWKPLAEQAIGWEPDINDGVRLNIRPFLSATPLSPKGKNACILRITPSIKLEKADRGKEPNRSREEFPWFWGWDGRTQAFDGGRDFDGKRWNNLHYTNAKKSKARARLTSSKRKA